MNQSSVRRHVRRLSLVLLCASLVACSTVRPVTLGQGSTPSIYGRMDDLHMGDKVTITTTAGQIMEMQLTELHPGTVEGKVAGQDKPVQLRDDEIKDIQRVEISGAKSAGMGLGLTALLIGVPLLLLIRALGTVF